VVCYQEAKYCEAAVRECARVYGSPRDLIEGEYRSRQTIAGTRCNVIDTMHLIDSTQFAVARRHGSVQNHSGSDTRDLLVYQMVVVQPVACKPVVIQQHIMGICRVW